MFYTMSIATWCYKSAHRNNCSCFSISYIRYGTVLLSAIQQSTVLSFYCIDSLRGSNTHTVMSVRDYKNSINI